MAPRKKAATAAKPGKSAKAKKYHNLVDPATKKKFIEMRDLFKSLEDRANSAGAKVRQYKAEIKEAGFSMMQIKDSLRCMTPEGEAEFKAELANRLLAAAYTDADVGEQLSLFLDVVRVPAVDRAYKEGQTTAMENKAAVPPYDPSTEQYRAFMEGFHDEQGRQVKAGIKKLDDKKAAPAGKKRGRPPGSGKNAKGPNAEPPAGSERTLIPKAEKDAKAAAQAPKPDSGPPRKPAAEPVTRASLAQQRAAAREEAESYFSLSDKAAGNA